jgi:hypothetical protein
MSDRGTDDVTAAHLQAPIQVDLPALLPSQTVHLLPCHIDTLGNYAAVSTYFLPKETDTGLLEAQFRGREMTGVKVPCPPGVKGYILKSADAAGERKLQATHAFDEMVVWNRDQNNKEERKFLTAAITDWPAIARAIHDPIEGV